VVRAEQLRHLREIPNLTDMYSKLEQAMLLPGKPG
jgi:hypothetical protein